MERRQHRKPRPRPKQARQVRPVRQRVPRPPIENLPDENSPLPRDVLFSGQYTCSACHHSELYLYWDATHQRLVTGDQDPAFRRLRWGECPAEGPEDAILVDPDEKRSIRWRQCLRVADQTVRLCLPVIRRRDPDDYVKVTVQLPVKPSTAIREWMARRGLPRTTRPPRHSIRNVSPLLRLSMNLRSVHENGGRYFLDPPSPLPSSPWNLRIISRESKEMWQATLAVAKALRDVHDPNALDSRTIHLPIELSQSPSDQFAACADTISEIRALLDYAEDRPPVRHGRREYWRDAYIYSLREYRRLPVVEIAERVFPGDPPHVRYEKTRKILTKVRAELKINGFSFGGS